MTTGDEPREWRSRDVLLWLVVVAVILGAISIALVTRPAAPPAPPAQQASPAPTVGASSPGG